jgi:hypothetical protein
VLVYYQGDTSEHGDEEPLQGPWVIDDVGAQWLHVDPDPPGVLRYVSTYARMHRAPDYSFSSQFVQNMTFQMRSGNLYGSGFLRLNNVSVNLGVDAQVWTYSDGPTYAWTVEHEFDTGPQLTSRGASNDTLTMTATGAAGVDLLQPFPVSFETLAGTPGVASFPAELVRFDLESVTISGVDGVATMEVGLYIAGGAEIVRGESAPLSNGTTVNVAFQELPSAPVTMSPTDRLSAVYFLHYTSSTPVTATLVYSSATHGTRITLPVQMAVSGSSDGDHLHLSNTAQDVASTDPAKAIPDHPRCAIGPGGREHHKIGTCTLSGGVVTMPADTNIGRLTFGSATEVLGINRTGFRTGADDTAVITIMVEDANPTAVKYFRETGSVSAPALPLHVATKAGNGISLDLSFRWRGVVHFMLDNVEGYWRQCVPQVS